MSNSGNALERKPLGNIVKNVLTQDLTDHDLWLIIIAMVTVIIGGAYLLTWIDQRPLDIPTPRPVYWMPDHIGDCHAVRPRCPD